MFNRYKAALFLVIPLSAFVGVTAWACGGYGTLGFLDTAELVAELGDLARADDSVAIAETQPIVEALRRRGYAGLDAVLAYRDQRGKELGDDDADELRRLDRAIEKIAGQRFARHSKLYWHTSLSSAMEQARNTNRPILSLRMLGRLDEDLSCANSRFFRTFLYPDPEIAASLREDFVLHWQGVRDVPVVTIDFGDGRELRQPLTGNSVHLLLDTKGRPIDALPGLVSPDSFKVWISEVDQLWSSADRGSDTTFWDAVTTFHRDRAERRRVESTLAVTPNQSISQLNPLDPKWTKLAASRPTTLSATSYQLINQLQAGAEIAMRLAPTKSFAEVPILRSVQPVEQTIARDTVFNLYALQTRIDDMFARAGQPIDYDELTQLIYSEVFQMPLDDPWLGLAPESRFAALENGGRIVPDDSTARKSDLSSIPPSGLNSKLAR